MHIHTYIEIKEILGILLGKDNKTRHFLRILEKTFPETFKKALHETIFCY